MVEAFGKYLLLEKIASGGMAEVYLAKSTGANGINKFLAIKRILPQYSDNPEFIDMFKEEAKIAVNLNHSNVVSIFDFGVERGQFFLVMEFVEGQNLRQILNHMKKEGKDFSLDQIVYVIKEVAAGLDHAHRCLDGATGRPLNITHRDMSPQNIMMSFEGEVKVVDFGIAKAENQVEHTRAGTIKGKFGYMSPEQADGQNVDLRTDIFSLGIVLWELLANDRLFVAQSEAATLRRVRECQIPSLRKINPNIPPELERIVNKALAKDRTLRYQTAAAFHKDLNRFLNLQYPEFSTQEFSKFMKSAYNKMYVENRRKFAEYAKLSMEEEKTAVTQTATMTMTSTDTMPSAPRSPTALKAITIAPGDDEPNALAIEPQTASKVDLSQLRRAENDIRSRMPGVGTRSSIQVGIPAGTQSRVNTRVMPAPRRGLSPTVMAIIAVVVGALGYVAYQGPETLFGPSSVTGNPTAPLPQAEAPAPKDRGSFEAASKTPNKAIADSGERFTEQVPLTIHSQPSGAIVYIDGQNRGFTPYRGWVELNKSFRVSLVKDSYLPYDGGEMKATGPEGLTLRRTLQSEPPAGYIAIEVVHGGSEPVISVNGVRLSERPPVARYAVPAGVPVKIRAYNPTTQLYAEETVIVGVGQRRPVRLTLGRSAQGQ